MERQEVMTEHWRHETVTALVSAIEAVEFNDKKRAVDNIKLALSYVSDEDFSWKCSECENPLIDCNCEKTSLSKQNSDQ